MSNANAAPLTPSPDAGRVEKRVENRAEKRVDSNGSSTAARLKGLPSAEEHPLASVIGSFADDPLWDDFLKAMEETRREADPTYTDPTDTPTE